MYTKEQLKKIKDLVFPRGKGKPTRMYHPLGGPKRYYCYLCKDYKVIEEMSTVGCKECEDTETEEDVS